MKETLILLKVQGVRGSEDQKPRVCLWWYVQGGDPLGPDGGVCCDDLEEGLRHVKVAIEEDLADRPEKVLTEREGRQPAPTPVHTPEDAT